MKRVLAIVFALLLVSTFASAAVSPQAQGTAQINGTVKDPSGAVLPGVEVTATQTSTNVSRQAVTDERGNFVLPNLPVGPYKVEAALPGFRTFVQTGIELGVNQNPNLNVTLEVGQVSQQVEVQANVSMVETQNLGVRSVIQNQEILELPLQSRNPTDLLGLSGGVVPDAAGNASTRSLQGGVGLSISGLAEGSTTFTLDGALHTNPFDNLNFPIPFPDALQEFSIQTGAQNANGGFQGGATVASVTKSGTNQFHGDAFDYYRNDKFGARGFFAATKGSQRRQQVGGTVGGPILKDKLFFFGAYQYTTSTSNPTDAAVSLPTAAMLNGDFSQFVKVYTDPKNQTGGCQSAPVNNFAGGTPGLLRLTDGPNFIDPKRFDPAAVKLIHLLPQVNGVADDVNGVSHKKLSLWGDNPMQPGHSGDVGNDPCGRVWYTSYSSAHDSQIIGKIDYQKSTKNTITGRFFLTPQLTPVPNTLETSHLGFQDTANLGGNGQDNIGAFFTIGDTYVISPTIVNSFNVAANRTFVHREGPFAYDVNDLGINAFTYLKKTFEFAVNSTGGGKGAVGGQGGVQTDSTNSTNTANISDNISILHGRHQISFGGSIATWKVIAHANVRDIPVFSFTPSLTTLDTTSTGLGWADFLLGHWTTLRQSAPNGLLMKQWYMGYHVQDQWKVSNRLTL
ncbi:MAG TPA: carboxypeptidase-like regulatory domain-containing protein, partial [Terriglobia bacterium]|nr:carboxypeptidase-like regulatory domain-containing protein [Terriglobia bacterium]